MSVDPDVLARLLARLPVRDVSCDLSDALGHAGGLGSALRPISVGTTFAGPAVTARPVGTDLSAVYAALSAAAPGSVLVVGAGGPDSAFWGETTTRIAMARGVVAAVIDGACRDVTAVRRLGFPVVCRGQTPQAGVRGPGGEVNVPVTITGVAVAPGDLVVGDDNGVVVLPAADAERTVRRVLDDLDRAVFDALKGTL